MFTRRIRSIVLSLALVLSSGLVFVPAVASADLTGDACQGINQLDNSGSTKCSNSGSTSIHNVVAAVVDILSVIVGFIAVIMIVVAGLRFVTAGGDANAVASARSTVIYALVGLVIVAIAQTLVQFVLKRL